MKNLHAEFEEKTEEDLKSLITPGKATIGTLAITTRNYIVTIAGFLIYLWASTILTAGDIGMFNLISQYVIFFAIFIGFGLSTTVQKYISQFISKNQEQKVAGIVYKILFLNCLIAIIFGSFFIFFNSNLAQIFLNSNDYSKYFFLVGFWLFFIPNDVLGQIFISTYQFKKYFYPIFFGDILGIILKIYFLLTYRNIDAFFLSVILSEGIKFALLWCEIALKFRKLDLSIKFREIIRYAFPLLLGNILNYCQYSISTFIFYYYYPDFNQLGILFYINFVYQAIYTFFSSMHNVLITYYGPIIHGENSSENYQILTFRLSKIFTIISFSIGLGVMCIGPFYFALICTLFNYSTIYSQAALTMIFFGVFFICLSYYFIGPAVIHTSKKSNVIVLIQAGVAAISIPAYFILIRFFGMVGIPIAYTIGLLGYYYFSQRVNNKAGLRTSFDKNSLKKILFASLPATIIVPSLFFFCSNDFLPAMIMVFNLQFPYIAFIATLVLGGAFFVLFFVLLRKMEFFINEDIPILQGMLGNKITNLISKILISKRKTPSSS